MYVYEYLDFQLNIIYYIFNVFHYIIGARTHLNVTLYSYFLSRFITKFYTCFISHTFYIPRVFSLILIT
jgi:hypothetical protein